MSLVRPSLSGLARCCRFATVLVSIACDGAVDPPAPEPDIIDRTAEWAAIKQALRPTVGAAVAAAYGTPRPRALATTGWEDGLHLSRDGLHLYALYSPTDLLAWTLGAATNDALSFCERFGTARYRRRYAPTLGMDMITNPFDCPAFVNVDIVYARRSTRAQDFSAWQLSGLAAPGEIAGSPMPITSREDGERLELFLFTRLADLWLIRHTSANPTGLATAERLPPPVNPVAGEFEADNPHLERLADGTLVLVYEQRRPGSRVFMVSTSADTARTWSAPQVLPDIDQRDGTIEHPHLHRGADGVWYLYFSLACDIVRMRQLQLGNFTRWHTRELVVGKGNTACVGEPSLADDGELSFVVVAERRGVDDTIDRWDIDPWVLPRR